MSVATTSRYDIEGSPPSTNRPPGGRRRSPRFVSPSTTTPPKKRSKKKKSEEEEKTELMVPPSVTRRSGRGSSSLWELARSIKDGKKVVFITGAGLSVASGIRPFRTTNDGHKYSNDWKNKPASKGSTPPKKKKQQNTGLVEEQPLGIWQSTMWTNMKRETYRKDPLSWWNEFWLRYFPVEDYEHRYDPNEGHFTLAALQQDFPDSIKVITQNVDGLQHIAIDAKVADEETADRLKENIIEAHGRLGLYKCLPEEDSDTDSSDDEDDDRPVHLGHRRKYRAWKRRHQTDVIARKKQQPGVVSTDVSSSGSSMSDSPGTCQYQMLESLQVDQLGPSTVRSALKPRRSADEQRLLKTPPRCPGCGNSVLPQALLFDEGYHSHEHYNFTKMEDWLAAAEVLVFVGTSFSVTLPLVALDYAREQGIPVYNFNVSDMLEPNARLHSENIVGPSQETLPKLWQALQYFQKEEAFLKS